MRGSMSLTRLDGRASDALRPIAIESGLQRNPEGSVLYRSGKTTVLVAASTDEGVRDWLRGKGKGWVTAEYAMHPRSGPARQGRDGRRGRDGRSTEIERLIGRSLRSAVDLDKLGERTISIDCDVLDSDGGTRTASISGGSVALVMALDRLRARGLVAKGVLRELIAAVSVGWVDGRPMLDLDYGEDSKAEVDLNVVASDSGAIVEVQGTAEGAPIAKDRFDALLSLALASMPALVAAQKSALDRAGIDWTKLVGR
jgi:ribonuclease PH